MRIQKRKIMSILADHHLSFVFSNNSIDVSLLEVCEKEDFQFDQLTAETSETDSHAGKIASDLQAKTFRIFQRKR